MTRPVDRHEIDGYLQKMQKSADFNLQLAYEMLARAVEGEIYCITCRGV